MTKKEIKQDIKKYGLYDSIIELSQGNDDDATTARRLDIIFNVLDNIDNKILNNAIKKACK